MEEKKHPCLFHYGIDLKHEAELYTEEMLPYLEDAKGYWEGDVGGVQLFMPLDSHGLRQEILRTGDERLGEMGEVSFEETLNKRKRITSSAHSNDALLALLNVGQAMAAERDMDALLNVIKNQSEAALNADRCSVFVLDQEKDELWSTVASGITNGKPGRKNGNGKAKRQTSPRPPVQQTFEEIRFPAHMGLAGYVVKTGETLVIHDAYADARFNPEIDKRTGYLTRNLICMPIRNRHMEVIGVFQVLNKRNGTFTDNDVELLQAISATAGVAIENALLAAEQRASFESFIKTLSSTIDARDPITAGHSERVAQYSLLIGDNMGVDPKELDALKYASLLHDIGKIGVREDVLTKPGRLTIIEYEEIQKHAYYTYKILQNIRFERHLKDVPDIAAAHHEKMDGTGYFRGLVGEEIPFLSRILALSDVFDAITSSRHYRSRMPFERVLDILTKEAGSHFDPKCTDAFFDLKLVQISQILITDRSDDYMAHGELLLKTLDKAITVREYRALLDKPHRLPIEEKIFKAFNSLYHFSPLCEMD